MSQPYTNIKEAIAEAGKYTEEKRSRVNWFDAVTDDRPVRQPIDDISPAATTKDRASKNEKP